MRTGKIMVGNTRIGEIHYLPPVYYIAQRPDNSIIGFHPLNVPPTHSTAKIFEFKPTMKHQNVVVYRCTNLEELAQD